MKRFCFYSETALEVVAPQEKSIVDQWPNQDFNTTEFKTLRNDISALVHAQTEQEYQMIASRLQEMKSDDEFNGLSDVEILRRIRPRRFSDLTEVDKFAEYLANLDIEKREKSKVKVEKSSEVDKPSEVEKSSEVFPESVESSK